ncbi:TonB-dependent receptor [Dasania marina]|uniref:TonB-dependent receptor n=1 Tax=Dasania marina TaxID=471499 RepID=UPI0030DD56DE|tara:strand:+ start:109436 stop:111802 length:2367 start_codon:yes stop_codon:yes gene_type:complete
MLNKQAFKKKALSILIPMVSMSAPVAVQAQGTVLELEEMVVSASRRNTTVMDIPSNISAVGGEALEKAGITDFSKLTRNIPGLSFSDTGPRNNGISGGLIMRGMNAQAGGFEDFYRSSDPAVSTYIGETPLFVNLNMRDINRVEVLRGPQGTLYGSGSLGGTVRYIQNKPNTEAFEAHVSAKVAQTTGAGDMNTDTEFMVNLPISDNMAIRAVGAYVDNSGFIDANRLEGLDANGQPTGVLGSKKDINGNTVEYARVGFVWDISDTVGLEFNHQIQSDNVDGRQAYSASEGDYISGVKRLEPFSRDVRISSLDIQADVGFATVSSSSSYYRNEAESTYDQSYNYAAQGFWAYYDGVPRNFVTGVKEFETDAFVQEVRLVSNTESDFDWVVGAYYSSWNGSADAADYIHGIDIFYNQPNPQAPDLGYTNIQKDNFKDKAVFGELTYHVTEAWQVTLGARFFDQTFKSSQTITLPPCGVGCGDGPTGLSGGEAEQDFEDEIFKFNTSYDLSETMMVFMTWAEGFRHGGSNGLPIDDPATTTVEGGIFANHASLMTFDADKATNMEVGFKGRFFDNHLEMSGAIFTIDWDDNQVLQRAQGGFPIVYNLGESKTTGLELEVKSHFTENLSLSLGYAYVNAETSEDFSGLPNLAGDPTLIIEKGSDLPGVPKSTFTAALDYSYMMDNGVELSYRLGGFYKESFGTDFNKSSIYYDEVDAQVIIDTSLMVYVDQWQFSLSIDNAFDSDDSTLELGNAFYQQYAGVADASNRNQAGDASYVVRPRTVGVGVKYTF